MPINWGIKKLLLFCLFILLAELVFARLSMLGYNFLIIRQITGFIFLNFIPGILILRIFKIYNLGLVRTTLYSVGLSISSVIFVGFFFNTTYPYIGVSKPISILPVTFTFSAFIAVLILLAYIRNKNFYPAKTVQIKNQKPSLSPFLFLILLPAIAALGALLVTYQQKNILLLILIPIITLVPLVITFNKFIPSRFYYVAVISVALALLFHWTLVNPCLSGWDIHLEKYLADLVIANCFWDITIPYNYNSSLSVTLLCPIYSLLMGMDSTYVFKIIYQIIFCLVPVVLFEVWQEQIGSKRAFLAAFFFMSMSTFFNGMPALARQQIAELFFALLILLMVEKKLSLMQKTILAIIFAISIPVSHYGLAYICSAFLVIGWLLLELMKNQRINHLWISLCERFNNSTESHDAPASVLEAETTSSLLNSTFVVLYISCLLLYYMYIASGSAFNTIVYIGNHIVANLSDFFDPMAKESGISAALGLDWAQVSLFGKGFRILQYITQLFIVIGIIKLVIKPKEFKFKPEYVAFTVVAALILAQCILIPFFSAFLNIDRFYHIVLIILSPFCILGGEYICQWVVSKLKTILKWLRFCRNQLFDLKNNNKLTFVLPFLTLVVLIPYFLFNTGFLFEIANQEYRIGDTPSSMALSNYRLDFACYNLREGAALRWLPDKITDNISVYADRYGWVFLRERLYGKVETIPFSGKLPKDAYIFLRTWNIEREEIFFWWRSKAVTECFHKGLDDMPQLLEGRRLIYDNGGAQIWANK